jgi:predicted RNA-binding protein with PUA-like domain
MSSGSTADEEEQLSANEVKLHIIYPDELAIEDTSSEEEDNNEYIDPKSTAKSNRW